MLCAPEREAQPLCPTASQGQLTLHFLPAAMEYGLQLPMLPWRAQSMEDGEDAIAPSSQLSGCHWKPASELW